MIAWLISATLCCSGCGAEVAEDSGTAVVVAAQVTPQLQTGTLICSQGDCLAVRIYTGSSITHVASVVVEGASIWVYDSTGGVGVRKLALRDYLASQAPNHLSFYSPTKPMTAGQKARYAAYLESQMGRPYDVKHHLTGNRVEGLHCAEYATDALLTTRLITAENPVNVSPASLVEGIVSTGVYKAGPELDVQLPPPVVPEGQGRCGRLWDGTKHCCTACCRKLSGWFLCR
jgi:hypothetical protein